MFVVLKEVGDREDLKIVVGAFGPFENEDVATTFCNKKTLQLPQELWENIKFTWMEVNEP